MDLVIKFMSVSVLILTLERIAVSLFAQVIVVVMVFVGMDLVTVIKDGLDLIVVSFFVTALVTELAKKDLQNAFAIPDTLDNFVLN